MDDLKLALTPDESNDKRDRLYGVIQAGDSKKYLGKELTIKDIETMKGDEVEKYYKRYEAKFGKEVIATVGNYLFATYARLLGLAMPIAVFNYNVSIDSEEDLANDLNNDPIISKSIAGALGEFCYNYGTYLSPLIGAIITTKHLQFNEKLKPININGGDKQQPRRSSTGVCSESTSAEACNKN